MHPIGQTCIYVWAIATMVAFASTIVFFARLITKKNRKNVKRVFWIATVVAVGAFVLYGVTSPVTRCKHEFTMVVDQPPTCIIDGKTEQYCPLCDYTKKDIIKATGHSMVTESKREPTYEANGELVEKCTICGYEVVTKIDMLIRETTIETTIETVTELTDAERLGVSEKELEVIEYVMSVAGWEYERGDFERIYRLKESEMILNPATFAVYDVSIFDGETHRVNINKTLLD